MQRGRRVSADTELEYRRIRLKFWVFPQEPTSGTAVFREDGLASAALYSNNPW